MSNTNGQVAHIWANGRKGDARSANGNLNFDGATIRSYRTPIACYVNDVHGVKTFLVTSETFSQTTSSKHMPAVRRAISGECYTVPFVGVALLNPESHEYRQQMAANLAHLAQGAANVERDAAKLRLGTWKTEPAGALYGPEDGRPRFIVEAERAANKAASFAEAFGLDYDRAAQAAAIGRAAQLFADRAAAYADPAAVAKRERNAEKAREAKARREEREHAAAVERSRQEREAFLASLRLFIEDNSLPIPSGWDKLTWNHDVGNMTPIAGELFPAVSVSVRDKIAREMLAFINGPEDAASLDWTLTRYAEQTEVPEHIREAYSAADASRRAARNARMAAEREAREAERRARRAREDAERLADFRAGERTAAFLLDDGTAALRREGDELVTSQGARVPWAEALRVFRFAKLCRERRQAWSKNGVRAPVGHFEVDYIEADGSFRAGCHRIGWAEQERLAQAEGLADVTPDASALVETDK